MQRHIKSMALLVPPIKRLFMQRDEAVNRLAAADQARSEALRRLHELEQTTAASTGDSSKPIYEQLEGTPYSRYTIPVDYLPSRHFAPRWGHTHPSEPILTNWFHQNSGLYHEFLQEMPTSAARLADIPLVFDEAKLPQPAWSGVPYCPFDAVALYTMIQRHKPRVYLEIGSGISTCFAYRGIKDAGLKTKIISIDPEPRTTIDAICDVVLREALETCDITIFDQLDAGDILFFDGSHRSFMNSDVTVFMIDVLPRLKPGVIIHIHDIMLPYDYPEYFRNWYWNEQYVLAVYLMGNRDRIIPLLPTAFICRDPAFEAAFETPMLDLGAANDGWRGGGAMWFTHSR